MQYSFCCTLGSFFNNVWGLKKLERCPYPSPTPSSSSTTQSCSCYFASPGLYCICTTIHICEVDRDCRMLTWKPSVLFVDLLKWKCSKYSTTYQTFIFLNAGPVKRYNVYCAENRQVQMSVICHISCVLNDCFILGRLTFFATVPFYAGLHLCHCSIKVLMTTFH